MSELSEISGYQRVAAFLLSLEPAVASSILKSMSPDVVTQVSQAMIDLDPKLSREGVVDDLVKDLARSLHRPRSVRACDAGHLRRLLDSAFGKQGEAMLAQIQEKRLSSRPFLELERHAPAAVAQVLRQESPSVVALVLAHLEPGRTAQILKDLDQEVALDVVRRMVSLQAPGPALVRTVAASLTERLATTPSPSSSDPARRLQSVAQILNNSAPEMEKKVIEALAETDEDTANELRECLFTWDDIGDLNRRAMTKILGTVDTRTLSVALKGCSQVVEQNVLSNLSSRVREMVIEERELAGPMSMADVKSARDEILKNIRALIEAGEFRPNRGGEQLVE
jgi:flagellar motor switch protein FliG